MYYIKLIYSKLTIIISPVLLITFGKLIIKLMSAPGVGYVSYNYQGYDVFHRDEKQERHQHQRHTQRPHELQPRAEAGADAVIFRRAEILRRVV